MPVELDEAALEAAARIEHGHAEHRHPSGRLTRWEELTPWQVEQFTIRARRALAAYFAALDPPPTDRAREIVERARVLLVHGGCNVPGYTGGVSVMFEDDDWRDLLATLGLFTPDTKEPSPMANDIAITFTREELAALDKHLGYEPMEYTPLGYAVLKVHQALAAAPDTEEPT